NRQACLAHFSNKAKVSSVARVSIVFRPIVPPGRHAEDRLDLVPRHAFGDEIKMRRVDAVRRRGQEWVQAEQASEGYRDQPAQPPWCGSHRAAPHSRQDRRSLPRFRVFHAAWTPCLSKYNEVGHNAMKSLGRPGRCLTKLRDAL